MDSTIETFLEDHGFTPIERHCPACQTQSLHSSFEPPDAELARAGVASIQMDFCVTCGAVELDTELTGASDEAYIATELDQLRTILQVCWCDLVRNEVH